MIHGNRTNLVPVLNKYSLYDITNVMRKERFVAKFRYYSTYNNNKYQEVLNNINTKKSVKLSLYNILSNKNFILAEMPNVNYYTIMERLSKPLVKFNSYHSLNKQDVIILKLITILLFKIYSRRFSPYSYTNTTHYKVLENIKINLNKKKCIIKGLIPLHNINIKVIMNILEKDIKDNRFTSLIEEALLKGYYSYNSNISYDIIKGQIIYNLLNKPIASSPFTSIINNIYLREFDLYMHKLQKNIPSNFYYVRYNDEFIIGLNDENVINDISTLVNEFFINNLLLNIKLFNYNIFKDYVSFLGHRFLRENDTINFYTPTINIANNLKSNFFTHIKDKETLGNFIIKYFSSNDLFTLHNTIYYYLIRYYKLSYNNIALKNILARQFSLLYIKQLKYNYRNYNYESIQNLVSDFQVRCKYIEDCPKGFIPNYPLEYMCFNINIADLNIKYNEDIHKLLMDNIIRF
jgi:hypothetical protein